MRKSRKRIASRKLLTNASYFAFTATPKNKTLELFGEKAVTLGDKVQFRSPEELTYTTKQAIQEGFILDVIANYTTYDSFYQVAKTVADDPEFDKVKALKKIRHYVESHDKAIRRKAEIMVDHFTAQVIGAKKIGGKARAMIVCNGIARAIDYWREVSDYLADQEPVQGHRGVFGRLRDRRREEHRGRPQRLSEQGHSGQSQTRPVSIPDRRQQVRHRLRRTLAAHDVRGQAAGGRAGGADLSRLNRAHPQKHDTFVLDFADNAEAVKAAFQEYYRATIQTGETDPTSCTT
jgi:type I restriction enzyme R subunit